MAGMLCCNPINVDDDIDDMELEDVWELQRSRSKSQGPSTKNKKTKNKFSKIKGSKSRQNAKKDKGDYGLKRVKSTGRKIRSPPRNSGGRSVSERNSGRSVSALKTRNPRPTPNKRNPRAASAGRPKSTGWGLGFGNEKKVSISNYVEKIDYPPEKTIAGRGRQVRAPPVRRNRSKSATRPKRRESDIKRQDSYDNRRRDPSYDTGKKKKLFSWGKKKKEYRQEEYYSSSESESDDNDNDYRERPNFFSMM